MFGSSHRRGFVLIVSIAEPFRLRRRPSMTYQTIYCGPVFDMARRQFDGVADLLDLSFDERDRLLYPKRAIAVTCPIHRDDGSVAVFEGYRVQHHLTLGPTKGGTRFAPNVDLGEVAALAIWMSWKCALSGLPYGGAKGGIAVDPRALSRRELEALSRRYMQEMIPFVGPYTDVMAPDLGTDEQVMAWFMDTYSMYQGRTVSEIVTGKPLAAGGTFGRRDATGNGVGHLAGRAMQKCGIDPKSATAVVQGFGNVGSISAAALAKQGVRIVGISDHSVALHDPKGFDLEAVFRHLRKVGVLKGFAQQAEVDPKALLVSECDVLVPAAVERVIDGSNARALKCRIIAEGANGPTTPDADAVIEARGDIFVIPDILCNAGGVIVSYFEWVQDLQRLFWDEPDVMRKLYEILDRSFEQVTRRAERMGISNRNAALSIGVQRVRDAKATRGLFP
jgi:glutamate dehydrogenase (NAD(P)+)